MATLADVCPHHETERGGSQEVLRVAPEAKVCARGFVTQVGRAVCGLRFDNPERIIADLGPTFRGLSIGPLALCALFDCLGAVEFVIKLPHEGARPPVGPRLVVPTHWD
jgi:hypothetical protein